MTIGIDASRAFLAQRTGIEEYAYQVVKHLRTELAGQRVVLYVRKSVVWEQGKPRLQMPVIDFTLPPHWVVRALWAPRLWTQLRLSWEMLFHPPDTLFVPAHTVPFLHPAHTIVTVHGLEYECVPQAYSFFARWYMRSTIRFSVRGASTVIAVSENTKRDLIRLYRVPEERIRVVGEGYEAPRASVSSGVRPGSHGRPALLFIGRLEERKNLVRIVEAFGMLKKQHAIPHQLILVGKPGYGYQKITFTIHHSPFKNEIQECGYVSEEEKWALLREADVFLFPSLYEGFGIPILEAQAAGVPVVASSRSSLPEVGGAGAVYCDPESAESIATALWRVLSDATYRDGIIEAAAHNVKRFSWVKTARAISQILSY